MSVMTKNGIADVVEMWHLNFVEEDAIFEFAGVPHHDAVAGDHVLAHVTTAADPAIFTEPRWAFQHRALLNNRSPANEYTVADERFSHQLAQNAGLQAKLQVAGNLFECVPDIILVF